MRQQHPGQGGTLPHALRVLADRAGKRGVETHRKQRLGRRKAGAGAVETGEVAQVLHGGKLVIEHRRMAHVADAGPLLTNLFRFTLVEDARGAHGWLQQPGEQAQQGGFAGAIFPQQHVTAAGVKAEGDPAQSREAAKEARNVVELS